MSITQPTASQAQIEQPVVRLFKRLGSDVLVLAGGFLLLVFFCALFSHNIADPAWTTTGSRATASNWLGIWGAWVADIFYFLLGNSVWLLWLALVAGWVRLLRKFVFAPRSFKVSTPSTQNELQKVSLWQRIWGSSWLWWLFLLVFILSACMLEWGRFYRNTENLPAGAGGIIGLFVGQNVLLRLGFNWSGVLGIVLLLLSLSWVFRFSWLAVAESIGGIIEETFLAIRARREKADDFEAGKRASMQRAANLQEERQHIQQQQSARVIDPPKKDASAQPSERVARERQQSLFVDSSNQLPAIHLLDESAENDNDVDYDALEMTSRLIEKKLRDFGVQVRVVAALPGPVITCYEIEPATGVKGSQIVNLAKDLARSLSLVSIRVIETIPGKNLMALELPNARRKTIHLSEVLGSRAYHDSKSLLTMGLGKDTVGLPVVVDLARMPHLLVAGTTGSGKSVGINAMVLSLLYKSLPEEVRLLMIDPKMLEMSVYEGIPHLIAPVVTDMTQAAHGLNWCVAEMERRYKLMSKLGVRNLSGYNARITDAKARGEPISNPFSLTPESPEPLERLPHIVIVIDELADLMMIVGKKIEELIARLAQKARAAGIHLILATQRPSVDVITGLIKANIPTRIAFQVSSKVDSRTILDQSGAETLLGMGDMLYLPVGQGLPTRVHGAFVSDEEVHRVVAFLKERGETNYIEGVLEGGVVDGVNGLQIGADGGNSEQDPLYDRAVEIVLSNRKASISLVQRHLRIGYQRSARIIDAMESAGLVSAPGHNGQREILVPTSDQ